MHIGGTSITSLALAVACATGCGSSKSDPHASSSPSSAAATTGSGGAAGGGGGAVGGSGGASAFGESQIGVGHAHDPAWVTHLGGPGNDEAFGVTAAAAGVFVSGETASAMFGPFD